MKRRAAISAFYKNNPGVGKERNEAMLAGQTADSLQKRSESMKRAYDDPALREKRSVDTKRLWNEKRDKMMNGVEKAQDTFQQRREQYQANGGHGSEQWREKISATVTQRYLDDGIEWARGNYISTRSGERYWYRSSWELKRMQELDADESIESWDFEPFWIKYTLDGRKRRYIPDFIVRYRSGDVVLEEVGVKKLKEGLEINRAKQLAAKDYCAQRGYSYRIWTPSST